MRSSSSAAYEDWELVVEVVDPSESGTEESHHWVSVPEAAQESPASPCLWRSVMSAGSRGAEADGADLLCAVSSPVRLKLAATAAKSCHSSAQQCASPSDSIPASPTAAGGDVVVQLRVTADSFLEMQLVSSSPACLSLLPPHFGAMLPSPFSADGYGQPESCSSDDEEGVIVDDKPLPAAATTTTSRRSFFRLVPMLQWLFPSILCLVAAHHAIKGGMGRRAADGAANTLKRAESGSLLYTTPLEGCGSLPATAAAAAADCRQAYGCSGEAATAMCSS